VNPRYTSPLAFRTAVERRLKDDALRTGLSLHRLRQLLVFDRYLARLFRVVPDAVVLKGGVALELRLDRARTTKDIDLRMVGRPPDMLEQLQAAGRLELDDYLTFEVQPDAHMPEIRAEALPYGGLRFRAEARLAGKIYGAPFGVDLAIAEPMVGTVDRVVGSRFLEFAGIEPATFRVYPVETHVAEKLHAYTLPRALPNSRVKDLPDIALLAMVGPLEARQLREAITRTFAHRSTHAVPGQLPAPQAGWAPVYARMAATDGLPWATLDEVFQAARTFLDPVLAGRGAARWAWGRWSVES